ncbi:phage tail tube protein [Gordonia sp. OPL2]|uniref:phage tail tube protein n=1 Tax=Gordonia sp. OPL2 TaxID=2486274 RepID=UPI0016553711|nr:hypothetical protein [Gordonia sp. OPL2]
MSVLAPPDTSDLDATLARNWAVLTKAKSSDPWTPVKCLTTVTPNMGDKQRQDAGDFHSGAYTAQIATEASWSIELGLQLKLDPGTDLPDPGQEILRDKMGKLGGEELVYIWIYRTDGRPESYQGRAGVTFQYASGDKAALFGGTVQLTGYGAYSQPAKPTDVAVNEVQRIEIISAPTTFKLKFLGAETGSLTIASLDAATLQTAITGLAGVGSGNAVVTGTNSAGYNVTFQGALAGIDVPTLKVSAMVGGTSPEIDISVVTEGHAAAA